MEYDFITIRECYSTILKAAKQSMYLKINKTILMSCVLTSFIHTVAVEKTVEAYGKKYVIQVQRVTEECKQAFVNTGYGLLDNYFYYFLINGLPCKYWYDNDSCVPTIIINENGIIINKNDIQEGCIAYYLNNKFMIQMQQSDTIRRELYEQQTHIKYIHTQYKPGRRFNGIHYEDSHIMPKIFITLMCNFVFTWFLYSVSYLFIYDKNV
jgi:hypothetical protein